MPTNQERNKANLLRLYEEVFHQGRIDAADGLITADRPDHDPNLPPAMREGRDGFKMFASAFKPVYRMSASPAS